MSGVAPIAPGIGRVSTLASQFAPGGRTGVDRRPTLEEKKFEQLLARTLTEARPSTPRTTPAAPVTATPGPASTGTGGSVGEVPFADLFREAGQRHGVDPALLAAVAKAESGFSPNAVSHAGAEGLMQLMPATAAGLGVVDSFDPSQAVDGAARLLAGHLQTYDGSLELSLAAYNAGGGAVAKFGGIPPYPETQAYVPKVLSFYEELRR